METFTSETQNKRADGTYNVRIRITHNKRLSNGIYTTRDQILYGIANGSSALYRIVGYFS